MSLQDKIGPGYHRGLVPVIHEELLLIYQSYLLMEADKVANVSLTLHKASTVPFRCRCRKDSDNDIRKSLTPRTDSQRTLGDLPILSTNGGR